MLPRNISRLGLVALVGGGVCLDASFALAQRGAIGGSGNVSSAALAGQAGGSGGAPGTPVNVLPPTINVMPPTSQNGTFGGNNLQMNGQGVNGPNMAGASGGTGIRAGVNTGSTVNGVPSLGTAQSPNPFIGPFSQMATMNPPPSSTGFGTLGLGAVNGFTAQQVPYNQAFSTQPNVSYQGELGTLPFGTYSPGVNPLANTPTPPLRYEVPAGNRFGNSPAGMPLGNLQAETEGNATQFQSGQFPVTTPFPPSSQGGLVPGGSSAPQFGAYGGTYGGPYGYTYQY